MLKVSIGILIYIVLALVDTEARPYLRIMILGSLLNLLVMMVNNGKMPVFCKRKKSRMILINAGSAAHCLLTKKSRFKCLADIYGTPDSIIISIGDIIVILAAITYFIRFILLRDILLLIL